MTNDLEEYYKHINYATKEVAIYEDEKGNYFNVSPSSLLVAVQHNELSDKKFEQAVFNQVVPKDMICNKVEIEEVVPKNEITKNPKDQFTLVTRKVEGREFWIVSNGLGMKKAFNNKEDALKLAHEINKKIFEVSEIEVYK